MYNTVSDIVNEFNLLDYSLQFIVIC